ncbi:MAG: DUF7507 domain-containing protein, partial [Candidatus Promineifilaceae bacterium]
VNSNFAQGMDFDNEDGTLYAWTYQGGGANQYGTIDLATGALTPLSVDNPQGEFEGATQTTAGPPGPCATTGDIPWVSVSPTAGTTISGATSLVDATFDATGLAAGVYTGTLCVASNDPDEPLVSVPLTLTVNDEPPPPVASIVLTKTVGTDPDVCASTDSIKVDPATEVTYCFTVQNTGNVTLTAHNLEDSELGMLLTGYPFALAPGASTLITVSTVIFEDTTNTATWTAFGEGDVSASDTDSATVAVSGNKLFLPVILYQPDSAAAPAERPEAAAPVALALAPLAALFLHRRRGR